MPSVAARPGRLDIVRMEGRGLAEDFAEAVRRGLGARPKTLPCRYFYDEAGSQLFERICDLPEYYLTRTEDAILRHHADEMVDGWDRTPALVELGSGSSTKTRRLIAAARARYGALHYYPIDVSAEILEESARALVAEVPGLRVTGYAADYRVAFESLTASVNRPKLVIFLGSSLGNYEPADAIGLLGLIAKAMGPDDRLLLGTDLAKDRRTLETAYDDARGVTAAFNLNLLRRINRELGGHFDPDAFAHRAVYEPAKGRVEMHLVSRVSQSVAIEACGMRVAFDEGEFIHTENSHKYTPELLDHLAEQSGFVPERVWTDDRSYFRVQRWRPKG